MTKLNKIKITKLNKIESDFLLKVLIKLLREGTITKNRFIDDLISNLKQK